MAFQKLHDILAWQKLLRYAKIMDSPEKHLRNLIKDKNRLEKFSLHGADIFYDFSRQRVDEKCMHFLFELAETRKLKHHFNCMASGEKVNITENRAVLHTASRSFSGDSVFVDNIDVMPEIRKVRDDIKEFVSKVHEKKYNDKLKTALLSLKEDATSNIQSPIPLLQHILRRFRLYEMVRIAYRDLAGRADLEETMADLSALADACVNHAYGTIACCGYPMKLLFHIPIIAATRGRFSCKGADFA